MKLNWSVIPFSQNSINALFEKVFSTSQMLFKVLLGNIYPFTVSLSYSLVSDNLEYFNRLRPLCLLTEAEYKKW